MKAPRPWIAENKESVQNMITSTAYVLGRVAPHQPTGHSFADYASICDTLSLELTYIKVIYLTNICNYAENLPRKNAGEITQRGFARDVLQGLPKEISQKTC